MSGGQLPGQSHWVSGGSVLSPSVAALSPPPEVVGSAVLGQSLKSTLVTTGSYVTVPNQLLLCIGATFVVLVQSI